MIQAVVECCLGLEKVMILFHFKGFKTLRQVFYISVPVQVSCEFCSNLHVFWLIIFNFGILLMFYDETVFVQGGCECYDL